MSRLRMFVVACGAAIMAITASPASIATAAPLAATGKLAYVGTLPGQPSDLYVADSDGSNPVDITNTPHRNEIQPAFSPDGQRLVFRVPGLGLWLINMDGSGLTQLTTVGTDQEPDWSPDGTQIVFSRCCDSSRFDSELYIANADGSNPHRILDNTDVRDNYPSWSPNGQWIAFTADPVGVFQIHPDGTGLQYLMSEFYGRVDFDWSPRGNFITLAEFTSFDRVDADLYGMKPFGTTLTQLTSGPELDRQPAWTPDASKVAFARTGSDGMTAIYTMNPIATGIESLTSTTDELSESSPTWQPV